MSRVKKGVNALKTRRNILKKVKGYRFGRGTKEKQAQEAIFHAGVSAFAHRKDKKNDMRQLWTIRLSAVLKAHNISYSRFIDKLKKAHIALNRKMLAEMASSTPEVFEKIIKKVS